MKLQQSVLDPRLQVNPDGAHIAQGLTGRFFKGEVNDALAATASGIGKVRRDAALAGASRTRDQHAAAAVIALAAQHGVESWDAGGNTLSGGHVLQDERGDR